jgi:hypothetical protein
MEDSVLRLLYRIVLIADVAALGAFVAEYTWRANWWSNPIGRTIVIKSGLLAAVLIPSILALFFNFSRLTSIVAAWIDLVLFALIAVVMVWRIIVFERIHRQRQE